MEKRNIRKYALVLLSITGLISCYFIGAHFPYQKPPEINNFMGITPTFHYTEFINTTEEIIFLKSEKRLSYLWRVYPFNETNSYLYALDIFLFVHFSEKIIIEYSWFLGKVDSVEILLQPLCNWNGDIEQDEEIPQLHQLSPYSKKFLLETKYSTSNALYFTLNVTLYLTYG